jgi:hypothetical protein
LVFSSSVLRLFFFSLVLYFWSSQNVPPFVSLFFFQNLSLSKTPLFFYSKKNLCSSLFPTNNLLIPLLVRLYFPFFSLFFLFISTKKNLLFFSFWISPCIYRRQGKRVTLPCPSTG